MNTKYSLKHKGLKFISIVLSCLSNFTVVCPYVTAVFHILQLFFQCRHDWRLSSNRSCQRLSHGKWLPSSNLPSGSNGPSCKTPSITHATVKTSGLTLTPVVSCFKLHKKFLYSRSFFLVRSRILYF